MYLHLFEIALYLLKKRLFLGVFTVFVRHKTPTTDEPTEKLSSYKDKIPQPTAQQQKSYPKDATDFINLKAKKASKRSDNHFNGHYATPLHGERSNWESEPTSNQERHSGTHSSQRVTNQELRQASLKAKRFDVSGLMIIIY
ncbi:hypothetical protein pdam_00023417 [Pocillopora damicornis]|uniref:Uncharacterized protein n=1 Tax=Pocillopora damicornis TaxID=46731 RepID=A0A3M6T6Y6_POCDA|nr:hypothetical protein pdam_00023417 [Pocillopora damicornis]